MLVIKKKLKEFKTLVKVLSNLNQETSFTFTPDEIQVRVVHTSNVCLINAVINKSMFEEYNVEKEVTYTLDNETFIKTLNRVGKKELHMNAETEGLRLTSEYGDFLVNYFVGIKDERPMPQRKISAIWRVNTGEFINLVGELIEFNNVGHFTGGEGLSLGVKAHLAKGVTQIENVEKIDGIDCIGIYDMGYMIYISSIRALFDKMEFGFGHQEPCIINASSDDVKFTFVLATRVEHQE